MASGLKRGANRPKVKKSLRTAKRYGPSDPEGMKRYHEKLLRRRDRKQKRKNKRKK